MDAPARISAAPNTPPSVAALVGWGVTGAVVAYLTVLGLGFLLLSASALGMYEALLAVELTALALLASALLMSRRRRRPSPEARRRLLYQRERRGF